jgi:3-oxoacyl-[acyl-carrier protein] reductase
MFWYFKHKSRDTIINQRTPYLFSFRHRWTSTIQKLHLLACVNIFKFILPQKSDKQKQKTHLSKILLPCRSCCGKRMRTPQSGSLNNIPVQGRGPNNMETKKMPEKRLAVVTGAARGIGRAIVLELLKQGRIVAGLDINAEQLGELDNIVKQAGFSVITKCVDITNTEQFTQTLEALALECDGIGVLVNNAGITRDNLLIRMSDEEFDKVLQVNLRAAFVAMRVAARYMMRNKFGRIINISSVSGIIGNAGQANYSASKAGLIGITKTVARELAKKNVTANCVAPGFIDTEMSRKLPEPVIEAAKELIPMHRVGSVEDVARAVAFLASDEAGYITGQVLCVDGGMAM